MKLKRLDASVIAEPSTVLGDRRQAALTLLSCKADVASASLYEPFMSDTYVHKGLGRLTLPPWPAIFSRGTADNLLHENPYTLSTYRKGGLAIWDAAVGIPACTYRPRKLLSLSNLSATRSINRLWLGEMRRGLTHVGPLGANHAFVRPDGPFIFDLTYDPIGWKLLEGAHALAHKRGDHLINMKDRKNGICATSDLLARCVAELVVCLVYGIPLDVEYNDYTRSLISSYGIELSISDSILTPVLCFDWTGRGAPLPDTTVAGVAVGVFTEPIPAGVASNEFKWLECNKWTCLPSIITIAGWELIDVITHAPLAVRSVRKPIVQYAINPADLMSPDTLAAVVNARHTSLGPVTPDNVRTWYVEDWLESQSYIELLKRTPPFPCQDCLGYNRRTSYAPKKPYALWKKDSTMDEKEQQEKSEWLATKKLIMDIAKKATIFCEHSSTIAGMPMTRFRKIREATASVVRETMERKRILTKKIKRLSANGMLSAAADAKKELEGLAC